MPIARSCKDVLLKGDSGVSIIVMRWQRLNRGGRTPVMEQHSRCSSPLLSDILSLVCGCLLVDDSSLSDLDDCLHKIRLI